MNQQSIMIHAWSRAMLQVCKVQQYAMVKMEVPWGTSAGPHLR